MIEKEIMVLRNGINIPSIAFGTWQIPDGEVAYNSTSSALKAGYRHIDTALAYGNEVSIGKAIKDSGIDRKDLFIVSKLPAEFKSYELAKEKFNQTLKNLDLDYLDLYLIHAPWPWSDVGGDYMNQNVEVWKAFIDLYNEGKIKAIGVSNFHPNEIERLIKETNFVPHVNQIRFFISNTQEDIIKYCFDNNILVEAYSPLATGKLLQDKRLIEMSNKYHVTPAKICIRYCIDRGTLPLVKSTHEERIKDNLDINFRLSEDDIDYLSKLEEENELKRPLRS